MGKEKGGEYTPVTQQRGEIDIVSPGANRTDFFRYEYCTMNYLNIWTLSCASNEMVLNNDLEDFKPKRG